MNRFLIFLLIILPFQLLLSQVFEEKPPEMAGFIPERLDRIDRTIDQSIEKGEIPGAVALIARNGTIAYHKSFGKADIESDRDMKKDDIFRIASMTKAVTTVGVMLLYEQGHFELGDRLSKFIPEFKSPAVYAGYDSVNNVVKTEPAGSEIRIIDLLTHTAGIGYPFIKNDLSDSYETAGIIDGLTAGDKNLKSQMMRLAEQPLLFEPGERFEYGLNTDLLGYFCEVISGKPLDRFFAEDIFTPLKMNDTYFYLPEDKQGRLVTLYAWLEDKGLVVSDGTESSIKLDNPDYPVAGAKSYFSGGAGLSSTAYDYARFIQMLLNTGELEGARILSRKSVELLEQPIVDTDDDGKPEIGLGFFVINDLGQYGELGSKGAYSWGGAFYTSYWIDPSENLIGVFMSQVRPARTDISNRFRILVYQALQ